jgi:hypothetical protein
MEPRAIAVHGGGDLVVGNGPNVEGLVHCQVDRREEYRNPGRYSFILAARQASELAEALRFGATARITTFSGSVIVSWSNSLAMLWFYPYGADQSEYVLRLYEGAIEAAAEALVEAADEATVDEDAVWQRARHFESPRAAA